MEPTTAEAPLDKLQANPSVTGSEFIEVLKQHIKSGFQIRSADITVFRQAKERMTGPIAAKVLAIAIKAAGSCYDREELETMPLQLAREALQHLDEVGRVRTTLERLNIRDEALEILGKVFGHRGNWALNYMIDEGRANAEAHRDVDLARITRHIALRCFEVDLLRPNDKSLLEPQQDN